MKRYILGIILTIIYSTISAQTQQGYVRTAGTTTKKGQPLQNVMIRTAGGTPVLSDINGHFTLTVSGVNRDGDVFQITSVRKNGYELLDKDGLRNRFVYSKNTQIEIVMISSTELLKIKQDIEERARKNATSSYEQKIQELKEQLEQQKVTIQEYNKRTRDLKQKMESFEDLIATMAEHYARTDYDKLDSLNAEINQCIAEGELDKADSLIDTKGNVIERANENMQKRHRLHNAERLLNNMRKTVDNNSSALQEERKRLDRWKKQKEQTKKKH